MARTAFPVQFGKPIKCVYLYREHHLRIDAYRFYQTVVVGYNNWMSYAYFKVPGGLIWGRIQQPHNIFIQGGAELGYTGLICFIVMIIFAFITNARTRVFGKQLHNKFIAYMAHGLDAGLVGYLVAGFFVTVLYSPFFWVQMGMAVALHAIATQQARVKEDKAGLTTSTPPGSQGFY